MTQPKPLAPPNPRLPTYNTEKTELERRRSLWGWAADQVSWIESLTSTPEPADEPPPVEQQELFDPEST